jgi:hypothetical protein
MFNRKLDRRIDDIEKDINQKLRKIQKRLDCLNGEHEWGVSPLNNMAIRCCHCHTLYTQPTSEG